MKTETSTKATSAKKADGHRLVDEDGAPGRDRPWIFRTYSGHTSARASNELYRQNLLQGQTGLSIAFDLPTQCGYDSDHAMSRPEIGKVGVPINSLDDMHVLFDGIPIERMNTSMTINATSMWLLSLYVALAQERGVEVAALRGTTQNDIIKEYLARGTYIFPPPASLELTAQMYEYCLDAIPKWNASNVCSYHLQEAGATPGQELAFALATAMAVLDLVRARGQVPESAFAHVVGRMSFFVNSGIRFVEEMCKMRAFTEMWDHITQHRYGVTDPKRRAFRYGVQVNSLGLTESQPENNAWRIALETLGVTLSRNARCRALQLPAWNEALSLPRPWDQQWALRLQQILAYETDLLEYPDLFDGSPVVASKVAALKEQAQTEIDRIEEMGGVVAAIESGYMKSALVRSMTERVRKIQEGELTWVGVNRWPEAIESPLVSGNDGGLFRVEEGHAQQALAALEQTRRERDTEAAERAIETLKSAAKAGRNLMEPSIACARARVTTGEWAGALRDIFGEYRPATGIDGQPLALENDRVETLRSRIGALTAARGRRPRLLVGKPGLDGHSNGAEVIAVSARHVGFDVIYSGIRLTPSAIVRSAIDEDVDLVGASVLSGSHLELAEQIMTGLRKAGMNSAQVVLGGIVPAEDHAKLEALGIAKVFTPADYELLDTMEQLVELLEARSRNEARPQNQKRPQNQRG